MKSFQGVFSDGFIMNVFVQFLQKNKEKHCNEPRAKFKYSSKLQNTLKNHEIKDLYSSFVCFQCCKELS